MARMIIPNLPVRDVPLSRAFWSHLGFRFDEAFSDAGCACMVINEQASVMLVEERYFHRFHQTRPHTGTETLICLTATSREEVDELCTRAAAAGASGADHRVDEAPMYGGSFRDLDGHIWEVLWMDPG